MSHHTRTHDENILVSIQIMEAHLLSANGRFRQQAYTIAMGWNAQDYQKFIDRANVLDARIYRARQTPIRYRNMMLETSRECARVILTDPGNAAQIAEFFANEIQADLLELEEEIDNYCERIMLNQERHNGNGLGTLDGVDATTF